MCMHMMGLVDQKCQSQFFVPVQPYWIIINKIDRVEL